jgi:hypothetical protein
MAVYVDGAGDILPADATIADSAKTMFVTTIYGVDDIRAQISGFYRDTAHGLTVGNYYYVTDAGDGGFALTPGTVDDVAFFVVDANIIQFIDNRPV